VNDAGALYRVIITVRMVVKSWPKLILNRCVFSCCRKEVKDETAKIATKPGSVCP